MRFTRSHLSSASLALTMVATALIGSPGVASAQTPPRLSIIGGDGSSGMPVPGPALGSPMGYAAGIAADSQGNTYIHDGQYGLERIAPDGTLTHFAGDGTSGPPVPGPAVSSPIGYIYGVAADHDSNVYVADSDHCQILRITPAGTLSIAAGDGTCGTPVPGPATASPLGSADNLGVDADGTLIIGDYDHREFLKVTAGGTLSVFAGTGVYGASAVPGPATSSPVISGYGGIGFDSNGAMYSSNGDQVIKITRGGTLSVIASSLSNPAGVAVDSLGNVYVADMGANVIDQITPSGTLTQFAGTGAAAAIVPGDPAASPLGSPYLLTIDAADVLRAYSDTSKQLVRIGPAGPSAPRSTVVNATTSALTVSFLAPVSPGESAITGYEYSLDDGATWHALTPTLTGGRLEATIAGLSANHAYPLQLRAMNAITAGTSAAVPTTTAAEPAAQQPPAASADGPAASPGRPAVRSAASAAILASGLSVAAGKPALVLTVRCTGTTACAGTLKVTKYVRRGGVTRKITVGTASYTLGAGADGPIALTLTAPGRYFLGRRHAPRLLHATARNTQGTTTALTALTIHRAT